jgi:hypothetical protein
MTEHGFGRSEEPISLAGSLSYLLNWAAKSNSAAETLRKLSGICGAFMRAPKQAPDQGRHTMKDPTDGDLTQPGDALLPFQPQVQDLAGRFPKRSYGVRGQVTAFSVVPPRTASSIEASQHVQSVNGK